MTLSAHRRLFTRLWDVGHFTLAAALFVVGVGHMFWGWQRGLSASWSIVIIDVYSFLLLSSLAAGRWTWLPNLRVALFALPGMLAALVLNFGVLYQESGHVTRVASPQENVESLESPWDATYYSLVTATTLGYGDYTPNDTSARRLVVAQLVSSTLILLVTLPVLTSRLASVEMGTRVVARLGVRRQPDRQWQVDTGYGWRDLPGGDELHLAVQQNGSVQPKT